MGKRPDLREYVPASCKHFLEQSNNDLKSAIPALARDEKRMAEIEQAVKPLPSHHDLYQDDS